MAVASLTPSDDYERTENDTLRVEEVDTHDVTRAAGKTTAAGERPNPINDFVDYLEYRVPNVIVRRLRETLYELRGDENLVKRQDIKYQGFEWVQRFSWINQTNSDHQYTETVEEGLTVRDGQETERNFGVSASFKGLGVSAGGYQKNFSERETSNKTTRSKAVTVPAQSTIYFYQKRYNFEVEVWFWQYVPVWSSANHFIVGANGTYARVQRTAVLSIYSEEYATLPRRLTGSTNISAVEGPRLDGEPNTVRQFDNITRRAKDKLATFGIRG